MPPLEGLRVLAGDAARYRGWQFTIRSIVLLLIAAALPGTKARTHLRQSHHHGSMEAAAASLQDFNDLLAKVVNERDAHLLECSAKDEAFQVMQSIAEASLMRAGRSLQALAAAEVHLKARHGALSVETSALETRSAELGRFCRQFQESSSSQKSLLSAGADLATKVMETATRMKGKYSAEMAKVQGSVHDQSAWLEKSNEACAQQLLITMGELNSSRLATFALEHELEELEGTRGSMETTRAALARNATDLEAKKASAKSDCDQYSADAEKQILELQSQRAAAAQGTLVTDCEVTNWRASGTCSKECMGGTRLLRREVLRNPSGGAPCPTLEANVTCNTQPCLVECQIAEWSEWTVCSALCNGGYRMRNRTTVASHSSLLQEAPAPLGVAAGVDKVFSASAEVAMFESAAALACGLAHEVESCNTQACGDELCAVEEWGSWGACTKACGGGQRGRKRAKKPSVPASGVPCYGWITEFSPCKEHACPSTSQHRCAARMDIAIMADASELLGQSEFDKEKDFFKEFIAHFTLNRTSAAVVGLVLYGRWAPDGVTVLPMTDSAAAIEERFQAAHRGRGGDQLENATIATWSLLQGWSGRQDAPKTLIVLLTGKPDTVESPVRHMKSLKEAGVRVIAIVVGSCIVNKRMLEQMVSEPAAENLFHFESFEELGDGIEKQVVNVCPILEGDEKETLPMQYLPTPL